MLVTRFAPSPTGLLHLGHAHSALQGWRRARDEGGRFLLRMEDIDQTRCRAEFEAAAILDLRWLGLDWDGGIRRQSEHFAEYQAALDLLAAKGLLYPCFCTRAEIAESAAAPHGSAGSLYPGTCRNLSEADRRARLLEAGKPYALRLDMARAAALAGALVFEDELAGTVPVEPGLAGDVVLARKEMPASYHLAVTLDDAVQGVTLVIRGADLFEATHVQRVLQAVLGLPVPRYHHHQLLTDETGRRYAKRDRALTLASLREAGRSPEEVRIMAGFPEPL